MIAYRLLVQEFPIAGAEWGAKAPRFVIGADGTYKLYTDVHIHIYTDIHRYTQLYRNQV